MQTVLLPLALLPLALAQNYLPSFVQPPSSAGFMNATYHFSTGAQAKCVSGYTWVASTSQPVNLTFPIPVNQSDVTNLLLQYITSGSSFLNESIGTPTRGLISNDTIGATYCVPVSNSSTTKVQLLTHGIGFTRSYWDFQPAYSYVDAAAANGYATFFYDRLGLGCSARPDPIQVTQTAVEIQIAASLGMSLAAGKFGSTNFTEIIGVGHSFGSIITQAATSMYPTLFDAAILTGFSANSSAIAPFTLGANFEIASVNSPYDYSPYYYVPENMSASVLVGGSVISTQTNFFRAPNFDPMIVALATAEGGSVTLGELFTQGMGSAIASNYSNPVAIVNGANDLPFCFGNCSYPTNLAAAAITQLYPSVPMNKTGTYLAPLTGHGLNLHYTAPAAYTYIMNFLKSQGL